MKAIHTFIETNNKNSCGYCPNVGEGKSDYEIRTRDVETNEFMFSSFMCKDCKIKHDNNQIPTCKGCGSLVRRADIIFKECSFCSFKKKYDDEMSIGKTDDVFSKLENQLHDLSLEHKQLQKDHVAGVEATLEGSKNWYDRKWNEEVVPLQEKSRRLSNENKILKKKIMELEAQLLVADEISKKVRRLSDENRTLKSKIEGFELETMLLEAKVEFSPK